MPNSEVNKPAHLDPPVTAGLSGTLRRLYIARDGDPAGNCATTILIDRAREAGTEAITLSPQLGDFNEDLRMLGTDVLRAALRIQIAPEDAVRFMEIGA